MIGRAQATNQARRRRQLGHPVVRLVRTHIGQLGLGTLRKGAWYQLDEGEVQRDVDAGSRTERAKTQAPDAERKRKVQAGERECADNTMSYESEH